MFFLILFMNSLDVFVDTEPGMLTKPSLKFGDACVILLGMVSV